MKCDICGKEAKTWGHCVCLDCYTTPKAKDKQLAIYKRALELACHYMEYEYPKKNDDIYYRKDRELEMIFLNKAKEELEEEE